MQASSQHCLPTNAQYVVRHDESLFSIHRTSDGVMVQEFQVSTEGSMSTSWSPDGTRIAIRVGHAMQPSSLHIWDVAAKTLASRTDFPATPTKYVRHLFPIWAGPNRILVPFRGQVFDVVADDLSQSQTWPTSTGTVNGLTRERQSGRTLMLDNGKLWLLDDSGQQTLAYWHRDVSPDVSQHRD
ncbi:MAG: hypothetical protein R3C49_12300 [Planctomycetaceae bacterium]